MITGAPEAMSLRGLVYNAVERMRGRLAGLDENGGLRGRWRRFSEALAGLLDVAEGGDFRDVAWRGGYINELHREGESPVLRALRDSCELAGQIDCFLSGPLPGVGMALARACPGDLDTLAVLADWLTENDWPRSAAEARRLLALVRAERSAGTPFPDDRPSAWWKCWEQGEDDDDFEDDIME